MVRSDEETIPAVLTVFAVLRPVADAEELSEDDDWCVDDEFDAAAMVDDDEVVDEGHDEDEVVEDEVTEDETVDDEAVVVDDELETVTLL